MTALKLTVLAIAGLSVAACSNTRQDRPGFDLFRSIAQPKADPVVPSQQDVQSAINVVLQAVDGPVALATFDKTKNNVVIREVATNGPYRSWVDSSTGERRILTTRNGVLTSSRGMLNDLMSSDVRQTLALVSSRRAGTATRIQRYLDSENQIYDVTYACTISNNGQTRVQAGEINRVAVEMVERCTSDERDVTNIYRVDGNGRILQSVQWFNGVYGTTVIQQLR